MPLYVPLDVDFATDSKFLAAGPVAGYLYIASLALAKRTMVDGTIERGQLAVLTVGFPGKPEAHAQRLVDVGLWRESADGWVITGWLKRNPSRKSILEKQAKKKAAGVLANHERWHLGGKRSSSCPHCDPPTDPITDRSTDDARKEVGSPEEEPKEEEKEEEEASVRIGRMIDAELASRLERRRRKGEDIGPALEALIRNDVERDVALFLTEATPRPVLKRVYACSRCEDRRQVVNDWDMSPVEVMVACPSCSGPETEVVGA